MSSGGTQFSFHLASHMSLSAYLPVDSLAHLKSTSAPNVIQLNYKRLRNNLCILNTYHFLLFPPDLQQYHWCQNCGLGRARKCCQKWCHLHAFWLLCTKSLFSFIVDYFQIWYVFSFVILLITYRVRNNLNPA